MAIEAFGLIADTSAFRKMASNFRKAQPASYRAAQKVTRAVAVTVGAEAKEKSSWSTRISGSVKVRAAGLGASVRAGGGAAYFAVPVENRGEGYIEHPTFGHDPVTSKNSHPAFMKPSFQAHVEEYIVALKEAVGAATAAALEEGSF